MIKTHNMTTPKTCRLVTIISLWVVIKMRLSQQEPGNELWSLLGKELGGILRPPPSQLPRDSPFVQLDFLPSSTWRFITSSPLQVAPAALLQMSTWHPSAAGYKRVAGSLIVTKSQTFLSELPFPATCVDIVVFSSQHTPQILAATHLLSFSISHRGTSEFFSTNFSSSKHQRVGN